MFNKKVLSIEISNRLTQIAEADYKAKNPKIHRTFIMETPEGVMNDGFLEATAEYVKQIKNKISQNRIKANKVVFTINSTKIASCEIMIPMEKDIRIADWIEANAADYFSVDLSGYELAYTVLDTVHKKADTPKYKVMVIAIVKSMLENYEKLAAELGCSVAAIDYCGNSLYQIVKQKEKKEAKNKGFLEAHSGKMLIGFVAASVIVLAMGIIPYSMERAININKTKQLEEYEEIDSLYRKYTAVKETAEYVDAVYESTILPTETLVDFLEEMESSMPEGMRITSFSANKTGINFSVITETKRQAAEVLSQLRNFESLKNISITQIRDSKKKADGESVEFSVTADYVNEKASMAEEVTEAEDTAVME